MLRKTIEVLSADCYFYEKIRNEFWKLFFLLAIRFYILLVIKGMSLIF